MPLNKKRKRSYGRTRPRKRMYRRRRFMRRRVPRPKFTGLGRKCMAKLRYVDYISIDPPAAGVASYVFRANSLYDPDAGAGGHQPMGFDQLMARYDHYTVVGSRIKVQYMPVAAASSVPGLMGVLLSDSGGRVAAATSISHLLEHPGRGSVANTGVFLPKDQNARVYRKFSAKKFFGKKQIVGDYLYRGTASSNPSEDVYFEVYHATVNGNDPANANFLVEIDYIAVFTEPKPLAQS